MKFNIIIIILILAIVFIAGCATTVLEQITTTTSRQEAKIPDKKYCNNDVDCVCGGIDPVTNTCFMGNRDYFDKYITLKKSCPEFCPEKGSTVDIKCIDNMCQFTTRPITNYEGCIKNLNEEFSTKAYYKGIIRVAFHGLTKEGVIDVIDEYGLNAYSIRADIQGSLIWVPENNEIEYVCKFRDDLRVQYATIQVSKPSELK